MKTNLTLGIVVGLFAVAAACGPSKPAENADDGAGASAGTAATGGSSATGGESTGGSSATGGTTTGGSDAGGGGAATGGAGTGGAATGGSDAGGAGTGGAGTGGAGAGGAGTGGAGTGGAGTGPAQPPAALVAAADATNGQKLYESEKCNNCHGTQAKGPVGKFPNLFKIKWDDKEVEEAFQIIKKGKSPMPPYGDKLTDKQIADIVAYVKKNPAK